MGLTSDSTGRSAADSGLVIEKLSPEEKVVALAGNPNVGKSTVFNELTGMNQHTGNWPGKTVTNAQGRTQHNGASYVLVDIPGTYSLMAHSAEEEVARDFLCFGGPDAVVVVCDATCLERNINLVLQTIEITPRVVVCVNLLDEAEQKKIHVDLTALETNLGVPVVGTSARSGRGLGALMDRVEDITRPGSAAAAPAQVMYSDAIEQAISLVEPVLALHLKGRFPARWMALRLIDYDASLMEALQNALEQDLMQTEEVANAVLQARAHLAEQGLAEGPLRDAIVSCLYKKAEAVCRDVVRLEEPKYNEKQLKIDRILTSKWTGIPIMLALLAAVFWITITGANYPSELLSRGLFWVQDRLTDLFVYLHAPAWLHGALVLGVYRVLAWVVSVMLPPMAIFFPLFTLLEDLGYLPRVAFNLDKHFQKCRACGKQALTMCMGFGCNAAGIVGCRIIDSPRERLIAILTNNFVPCNGRFPTFCQRAKRKMGLCIAKTCSR